MRLESKKRKGSKGICCDCREEFVRNSRYQKRCRKCGLLKKSVSKEYSKKFIDSL